MDSIVRDAHCQNDTKQRIAPTRHSEGYRPEESGNDTVKLLPLGLSSHSAPCLPLEGKVSTKLTDEVFSHPPLPYSLFPLHSPTRHSEAHHAEESGIATDTIPFTTSQKNKKDAITQASCILKNKKTTGCDFSQPAFLLSMYSKDRSPLPTNKFFQRGEGIKRMNIHSIFCILPS